MHMTFLNLDQYEILSVIEAHEAKLNYHINWE